MNASKAKKMSEWLDTVIVAFEMKNMTLRDIKEVAEHAYGVVIKARSMNDFAVKFNEAIEAESCTVVYSDNGEQELNIERPFDRFDMAQIDANQQLADEVDFTGALVVEMFDDAGAFNAVPVVFEIFNERQKYADTFFDTAKFYITIYFPEFTVYRAKTSHTYSCVQRKQEIVDEVFAASVFEMFDDNGVFKAAPVVFEHFSETQFESDHVFESACKVGLYGTDEYFYDTTIPGHRIHLSNIHYHQKLIDEMFNNAKGVN